MSLAALLLTLLAVAAWTPTDRRPPLAGPGRRWWRAARTRPRPVRRRRSVDLAAVVTEVASRLRTGLPPDEAWARTVARYLGPASTGARGGGADGGDVPPALVRLAQHCAREPDAAAAVRTVVAATRLTQTLGAPLAEVLDRCASSLTEAEQARDARRVALAGPRSTARILAVLPLLGLLLGAGLGAEPLRVATDGGWGSAAMLLGLALVVAGRRWVRLLVTAAERPTGPASRGWRPASA